MERRRWPAVRRRALVHARRSQGVPHGHRHGSGMARRRDRQAEGGIMRGHIASRGPINPKTKKHEGPPYAIVVELGEMPAQMCPVCTDKRGGHKLHWITGKALDKCPTCDGELDDVLERRQYSRSGFKLKREADAALVKQLDARNQGVYQEPTNTTVAEFLVKRWLPD